jgi:3-hydroxyacyl-CoA dehydrogenase
LFVAEREALRLPEFRAVPARPVECIGIIGAGAKGTGIALAAIAGGFTTLLLDEDPDALARSSQQIHEHLGKRIASGRMGRVFPQQYLNRLELGTDPAMFEKAQLIIEAVYEDLPSKRSALHRIEPLLPPEAVLATSTSRFSLDTIAEATERPQNVVGLHFFNPAQDTRLVEVVRGVYTSPAVLATGFAVVRRMGKLPILSGNSPGFIGDRIHAACRRQCESMLAQGALPAQIDAAVEAFGFAAGPFAAADTADRAAGPGMRPTPAPGAGRRAFTTAEIQERLLVAMANEAALLLNEEVTSRASDIDLVMVHGFGFPNWEGGPVFWASRQDPAKLRAALSRLQARSGADVPVADLGILRRLLPPDRVPAPAASANCEKAVG